MSETRKNPIPRMRSQNRVYYRMMGIMLTSEGMVHERRSG